MIAVICDNDSIHHARKVTAYLEEHPRLELLYGARYSLHDNPADEWQVGERRYLSEGSMALLIKPPASSEGLATPALLKA